MNKVITIAIGLVLSVLATFAQVPQSDHVFVVMEENHSYNSVIGNSSMPYLNSLAQRYGLATQYYANTHPSIGNYFMLTTGQILTNNDNYTSTVTSDNLVRHFLNAGKSWKSYAEGLPSVGYTGGDTGYYLEHHNPFAYFSDVRNSSNEKLNLVPFGQFQTDLNNGQLPNFSYIVPNIMHDAHDGSLAAADQWLQQNIAPVLSSSAFQQNGLMIIVFDESADTDTTHGGGHVAMLVISPKGKSGYKSGATYQHQSTLRLIMEALGMSNFPAAAANAPDMSEFFGSSSSPSATPSTTASGCAASSTGVRICSPSNGQTVSSPVQILAGATSGSGITTMQVYVDNQLAYAIHSNSINTGLSMGAGGHYVVVQAWDVNGNIYKTPVNINVGSTSSPTPSSCSVSSGVNFCSPTSGSTTGSTVQIVAGGASYINTIKLYVDGHDPAQYTSSRSMTTSVSLSSGSHNLTLVGWDTPGNVYTKSINITVSGSQPSPTPDPTPTTCGASSGVAFCSPTSGSTTSTSVQVSAAGASYITAIALYLDGHDPYVDLVHSTKLTTTVNVSSGSHNLALVGWDSSGNVYQKSISINASGQGSPSPTPSIPAPPSNATVISNIQNQQGWLTCGGCGNAGGTGQGPNYNIAQWISSPSLSGQSADFYISSGPSYAGAYYYIEQPKMSNPVTYLKYEFDLYVPSAYTNTPQALEFECQQNANGYTYNYAWQADYDSNTWRVFNYTNRVWESTGIPLQRFAPGWHHIIALYHASGTHTVHDSLTVDGVTHNVNIWHSAKYTGNGLEFTNAFQLDLNGSGTPYKVYVDNMKVTVAD